MNMEKLGLFTALGVVNLLFVIEWIRAGRRMRDKPAPTPGDLLIGFITDFGDTLGIGSFAPTTAIFKFRRRPPDELIPGTLNVGHNSSAITETVIFVTSVAVDPVLLASMVASAALGAWLGAGVVTRMPRRAIQVCMGAALSIAAIVFCLSNLDLLPAGGTAIALSGWRFGLAVVLNFIYGALMSAGIGLYAPCLITLALLGLNPLAAFPIFMGSCGLVQPVAGLRFLRTGRFAWGPSLGLAVGGVFGVLVAAFIVKSLPLTWLRWLVIVVVAYAALSMLRSAAREPAAAGPAAASGRPA